MIKFVRAADHTKHGQLQPNEIRRHTLCGTQAKTFQVEYVWVKDKHINMVTYTVNRYDAEGLARADRRAYIAANSYYDLVKEFIKCRF